VYKSILIYFLIYLI